ncbi:hypothetical protein [Paenibacillus sp. Marseille-Q4541]|uniref:hypothetical protein n=1 Tax=Paenibacillus sp. Marseille-Q4541 TaxID=2831522 RepID=UPI001BA7BF3F|nr:hypothetical protein [Paenibacillus sp. Marseille-Q4541]
MKRRTKVFLASVTAFTAFSTTAFGWSYSDYSKGSYVPKSGTGVPSLVTSSGVTRLATWVSFKFDATNRTSILDYNDGGDNPGTACDNSKAYFTLDQTAVPDSNNLEIDADEILTNLPSPKLDIEDNNFFGQDDESEVTALGTINTTTTYYMETRWNDLRDGGSGDSGKIQAQMGISEKGLTDYNNCTQSTAIQHTFTYGDNLGSMPTALSNTQEVENTVINTSESETSFDAISQYKAIDSTNITEYVNNNKNTASDLGEKNIEDIAVTITFDTPVDFSVVKELAATSNLNVEYIEARGIDENGDRVTSFSQGLNEVSMKSENVVIDFKGYTALQAKVDSSSLKSLTNTDKIYSADVSGDNSITNSQTDSYPVSLTWLREDYQAK